MHGYKWPINCTRTRLGTCTCTLSVILGSTRSADKEEKKTIMDADEQTEEEVLTFDASLIQRDVGARGWGALTEHHLLVAMRDAMSKDAARSPGTVYMRASKM